MLSKKEKLKIIKLNLPRSIYIPSIFISGNADWGIFQKPGDLEKMENIFFKNYFGRFIIQEAGHWVQQEQPNKTFEIIINFLKENITFMAVLQILKMGHPLLRKKALKVKKF